MAGNYRNFDGLANCKEHKAKDGRPYWKGKAELGSKTFTVFISEGKTGNMVVKFFEWNSGSGRRSFRGR